MHTKFDGLHPVLPPPLTIARNASCPCGKLGPSPLFVGFAAGFAPRPGRALPPRGAAPRPLIARGTKVEVVEVVGAGADGSGDMAFAEGERASV